MELNKPSQASGTGFNLGNAQRPGEYLRQLRLAQKKELADVARALNMPERQVVAIESDDYKSLPEPAFIKGYLRTYARLLGTEAEPLVHRFNEIYTSDTGLPNNHALENSPLKALGRIQSRRKTDFQWLKWLMYAVLAAALVWVMVIGIQYWRSANKAEPAQQAETPTCENDTVATASANAPTILSVPVATTRHQDQLSLTFKKPVEVLIKDATGKTLATGVQSEALTLNGDSPFSIRLAEADQVSLSMNNESVSLSPYTVNGRADFRLSR